MESCIACGLSVERYCQPEGMDESSAAEWWDLHNEDWCSRCGEFAAYDLIVPDQAARIRAMEC